MMNSMMVRDFYLAWCDIILNGIYFVDMDVDLAQPEFDGRWDKQAVKQEIDPLFNRSKHWKTKMDKVNFRGIFSD